jgi:hypothetical protein
MVALVVVFPGLKKAFSDVIGYAVVSTSVTNIFSELLYSDVEAKKNINNSPDKELLEKAEEAIMKIVQNKTVFVNQIEPDTFDKNWEILEVLMKEDVDKDELKKQLFYWVLLRDIIGEFCWYIYTGIFVSFIVFYNVSIKSCKKSVAQLQQEFSSNVPPPNSGNEITQYSTYTPT